MSGVSPAPGESNGRAKPCSAKSPALTGPTPSRDESPLTRNKPSNPVRFRLIPEGPSAG
jgi:hypothetical protein